MTVRGTQKLDYNDPGHFFDVEYKIPEKLTRAHPGDGSSFRTAGQVGPAGCRLPKCLRR